MADLKDIGRFPEEGNTAREKKLFYKLSEEDSIHMISGTHTPALISLWASNDVMQFGTYKLLSGGPQPQQSEYDSHPGDAVFYVSEGTATFFLPDTKETFLVEKGDFMTIPENTQYKIINYYAGTLKMVFVVAPKL